jgi:dTDP-4-amino-4,6-dideoxygalactose transaminase
MYKIWPQGKIPSHLQRPELKLLSDKGYRFNDPFEITEIFERKVAQFAGSQYAVAVDCCSHGLFLCLKYLKASGNITIPKHTYVSVPMQVKHAGCDISFENVPWQEQYQLYPHPVWDGAALWQPNMYREGFLVISFQIKKPIPIGRGGMILTNDLDAVQWLNKARYDGRQIKSKQSATAIDFIGWHYYMTPEDSARGILLFDELHGRRHSPSWQDYFDISQCGNWAQL